MIVAVLFFGGDVAVAVAADVEQAVLHREDLARVVVLRVLEPGCQAGQVLAVEEGDDLLRADGPSWRSSARRVSPHSDKINPAPRQRRTSLGSAATKAAMYRRLIRARDRRTIHPPFPPYFDDSDNGAFAASFDQTSSHGLDPAGQIQEVKTKNSLETGNVIESGECECSSSFAACSFVRTEAHDDDQHHSHTRPGTKTQGACHIKAVRIPSSYVTDMVTAHLERRVMPQGQKTFEEILRPRLGRLAAKWHGGR